MNVPRPGSAIVAALALVALAGALLGAAAVSGRAAAQAALTERTTVLLEGEARRAIAGLLLDWPTAADSLPEGGTIDRMVSLAADAPAGLPITGRLRVRRLGPPLFAVTAELRLVSTDTAAPVARRRLRLVTRQAAAGGSPTPIGRWSLSDLQ